MRFNCLRRHRQGNRRTCDKALTEGEGREGTMKSRLALVSVLAVLAMSFGLVSTASAATTSASAATTSAAAPARGSITTSIPCTVNGVPSTCQLKVTGFQLVNGTLTAVGTVTGGGVSVPFTDPVVDPAGTCQILNLTLGPLHLDLLGLVVNLNQVHLTITAQQGPGNLLGNLLCAVANLLNNTGNTTGALQQIVNLLNQILAGL